MKCVNTGINSGKIPCDRGCGSQSSAFVRPKRLSQECIRLSSVHQHSVIMTGNQAIPILLCGQIESHLKTATERLQPEFKGLSASELQLCIVLVGLRQVWTSLANIECIVAHISRTTEDAIAYFNSSPDPKPRAAIMGGEYQQEDLREIQSKGAPLAIQIPWIRPEHTRPGSTLPKKQTSGTTSEVVIQSVKAKLLDSQSQLSGTGPIEGIEDGGVWYFTLIQGQSAQHSQ